MKILGILFALTSAGASAVTSLPTGRYKGTGLVWTSKEAPRPYRVAMQFQGNTYVEQWASATRQGKLHVSIRFETNGRLTMTIQESTHGPILGYCGAFSCHVEGTATNGAKYEQTFFFEGQSIRKVGSETSPEKTTMWESTLEKQRD